MATRGWDRGWSLPEGLWRERHPPAPGLLATDTSDGRNCCFKPLICGHLLQQLQETHSPWDARRNGFSWHPALCGHLPSELVNEGARDFSQ